MAMDRVLLTLMSFWCCSLPYEVFATNIFDPAGHLDRVDHISLQAFEEMYPLLEKVSIIVTPKSISSGKEGQALLEKYAADLLGNSSDAGLVVGVSTSSSQVWFFNSNPSPTQASAVYDQIRTRSEEVMQYSILEGMKQLLKDLHCFTTFKSIDNQSIIFNTSRFLWEPVINFISLISAICLILIQHSITAIASLPKVGNPKSSKSQLIALVLEKWPWSEDILSLLLFCATSIFVSSVVALLFCVGLFLYQTVSKYSYHKNTRAKDVNRSSKSAKSEMISSVSKFRDLNGIKVRTTTTTAQRSSKVSTVVDRKVTSIRGK